MMAALDAYQGGDLLSYPLLDYARLARAVAAALDAEKASFRAMLLGDTVSPHPASKEDGRPCRIPGSIPASQ